MVDGRLNHLGPDFPTLIRQNSATSPDIILSNRCGYLNTRIIPGNITTSDHLPIILELSTNPILIPTTPRFDHKANWDRFRELLQAKPGNDLNGKPILDIDLETERWYDDLIEAKEACIPKTAYRTARHPASSPEPLYLQSQYEGIRTLANIRGWDQELRQRFNSIRVQLTETCKWAELTTNLASKSKDLKDF